MKIKEVRAREVLDSRGVPTLEAAVKTKKGWYYALVPSGTSSGSFEAHEMRDKNMKRYFGMGVTKAITNVEKRIAPKILGKNAIKQKTIDLTMLALDKTDNKKTIGGNAMLAVSLAVARAGAASRNKPLYKHIQKLVGNKKPTIPVPFSLILEGGKHADKTTHFQEFMIIPKKAKTFKDATQMIAEIYHETKKLVAKEGFGTQVGLEGAFAPQIKDPVKLIQLIQKAAKKAGYTPGKDIGIAIDAAATEFYRKKQYYPLTNKPTKPKTLQEYYQNLNTKHNVMSIEDGFSENDWENWTILNNELGKKCMIVGDDLLVTNPHRIQEAIEKNACNTLLLKVNQIGTLTEALEAYKRAKSAGWKIIVSHRSGDTEDPFIADLAVGISAEAIKIGAPARGERTAKYNQLMRIEATQHMPYQRFTQKQ